ncbi:hypothetical protein ABZY83_10065 [Streptomyces virginiae]|uniref:hypothetical protein n=1 Tax=Streptomyces TaxID=1883 RepID=UPI000ADD032B|nr:MULTISPECIES: hypothetical protein [unclassified Streptomyces]
MLIRIDRHGRINLPMHRGDRRIGDPTGRMTAEAMETSQTCFSPFIPWPWSLL